MVQVMREPLEGVEEATEAQGKRNIDPAQGGSGRRKRQSDSGATPLTNNMIYAEKKRRA